MAYPPLDPRSPSKLIALRLPASLLRAVDAEARRRGVDRSAAVRLALSAFVAGAPRRTSCKRLKKG